MGREREEERGAGKESGAVRGVQQALVTSRRGGNKPALLLSTPILLVHTFLLLRPSSS